MKIYKDWLNSNGIRFTEDSDGNLLFTHQGGHFILTSNKNDKQFMQIFMPNIYHVDSNEKAKAILLANKINVDRKCVKAVFVQDEIWLSVEILIDSTPDVGDFFDRLLTMLHQGRMMFQSLI